MKLYQLKNLVKELEELPDNLELKVFDEDGRLRDIDISVEVGGFDSKDKFSKVGKPCLVVYGV